MFACKKLDISSFDLAGIRGLRVLVPAPKITFDSHVVKNKKESLISLHCGAEKKVKIFLTISLCLSCKRNLLYLNVICVVVVSLCCYTLSLQKKSHEK